MMLLKAAPLSHPGSDSYVTMGAWLTVTVRCHPLRLFLISELLNRGGGASAS